MASTATITATIDGMPVVVEPGTTILAAAAQAGIAIPSLCSYPGIEPPTSCFVCVVRIEGRPGLTPSCVAMVEDGMVVDCSSNEIRVCRQRALELLLSEHAGDCEAPCRRICPCKMDIPAMIRHSVQGDREKTIMAIKQDMPFPALLGHICPAPCQRGCRRAKIDTAISICDLHRRVGLDDLNKETPWLPACAPPTGKTVAIVGAGPAGMSAAWYLSVAGHQCTLYDQHDQAGGMLARGVAGGKLPPEVLDKESALLERLGVRFVLATPVNDLSELEQDYDALILATGESDTVAFGLTSGPKGIAVETGTFLTSRPGTFACGGAIVPGKLAVRSVGQGHDCALVVNRFLCEGTLLQTPRLFDSTLTSITPEELETFRLSTVAELINSSGTDFAEELTAEAARCLSCDCSAKHDCDLRMLATKYAAVQKQYRTGKRRAVTRQLLEKSVVYESGKCILCGRCVGITKEMPAGLAFVQRGFETAVDGPLGASVSAAMGERSAMCIEACPTAALGHLSDSLKEKDKEK